MKLSTSNQLNHTLQFVFDLDWNLVLIDELSYFSVYLSTWEQI